MIEGGALNVTTPLWALFINYSAFYSEYTWFKLVRNIVSLAIENLRLNVLNVRIEFS